MAFEKLHSAGYLANHMARLFARELQARIKPMGLSTGVFPALLELWEEDALTQKDLVERLDIEQATMANTLARMERDGLITRQRDPADARVQRIWLTDTARTLHAPATEAALATNALALAGLSSAETAQFLSLMRRTIATLQDGR